ncbi:uncharacterized protein L969DRAFT_58178 [Mixia osmundae IAM 14324]|uniref:DH domain-containing protein n=1 Tax=Mixia osmundae (strain CBS 9802 / IAM 14324 / JCM 22182 / KY 12970) TaxID=764103 RepID=G7DXE5_MIXOS|nr:uncharacterized protein L969DRAFT_58178 [Mixia osmundae IAM 14324]KEI41251.1 hypothetical protein L969DRAFT_58178 [Mixia osmundae IAM 14324]GAA95255.1 hypothetical protein E5Q_01911 [Mixia osmundae IAM 14324]
MADSDYAASHHAYHPTRGGSHDDSSARPPLATRGSRPERTSSRNHLDLNPSEASYSSHPAKGSFPVRSAYDGADTRRAMVEQEQRLQELYAHFGPLPDNSSSSNSSSRPFPSQPTSPDGPEADPARSRPAPRANGVRRLPERPSLPSLPLPGLPPIPSSPVQQEHVQYASRARISASPRPLPVVPSTSSNRVPTPPTAWPTSRTNSDYSFPTSNGTPASSDPTGQVPFPQPRPARPRTTPKRSSQLSDSSEHHQRTPSTAFSRQSTDTTTSSGWRHSLDRGSETSLSARSTTTLGSYRESTKSPEVDRQRSSSTMRQGAHPDWPDTPGFDAQLQSTSFRPEVNSSGSYRHDSLRPQDAFAASQRIPLRHQASSFFAQSEVSFGGNTASPPHAAMLSSVARYVLDNTPLKENVRRSIPYPSSFTGTDLVTTLLAILPEHESGDRKAATLLARELHAQLFFFEVQDNGMTLHDSEREVYTFGETMPTISGQEENPYAAPGREAADHFATELPTAVLTAYLGCYSPFCGRDLTGADTLFACYSPSCPNNPARRIGVKRKASSGSLAQSKEERRDEDREWPELVQASVREALNKTEIERQCNIHELIRLESNYQRELGSIQTVFVDALVKEEPPIIPKDRLPRFLEDVWGGIEAVREQSAVYLDALKTRQQEQWPVLRAIGDVVLDAALAWAQAYLSWIVYQPMAEVFWRQEKADNPAFDRFLTSFPSRIPGRHEFRDLHFRAIPHLQRIKLSLETIQKHTAPENPDVDNVAAAIEVISRQLQECDAGVALTNAKIEKQVLARGLIDRNGNSVDLGVLNPTRQLIRRGRMLRKPEGINDWSELHAVLFDHCFVLTKERRRGSRSTFTIWRRPLPLEMLVVSGFTEPPVSRSTGFSLRAITGGTDRSTPQPGYTPATGDERLVYPITFRYLGRHGGTFVLFVDSPTQRADWQSSLTEATRARELMCDQTKVIEPFVMSDQTFVTKAPPVELARSHGTKSGSKVPYGAPTCSTPFTIASGRQLVAIGNRDGLWIGLRHDPTSLRLVAHLHDITQCAVLQEFGLMVLLAHKKLYAYAISALVPSGSNSDAPLEPQHLSGNRDVAFFDVGKTNGQTLVIYVKKSSGQSVFKALAPVPMSSRTQSRGVLRRKAEWFTVYKDFFLPAEAYSILFLRSQLAIVCARGFELMDMKVEPLRATSFPEWSQLRADHRAMELQARCSNSRALGMFKISPAVFLFCYSDLAFYTDKHGDPLPDRYKDIIDWECEPRAVAYQAPFILAFDVNVIEVRHAESGQLLQVIKGKEFACLYNAQASLSTQQPESGSRVDEGAAHVHAALNIGNHFAIVEFAPTGHARQHYV